MRPTFLIAALTILAPPLVAQRLPAELDGWPVIELTRAYAPDGEIWVGTYGHGVLVHPPSHDGDWRRIQSDSSDTSLSWDFVHAIAFGPTGEVWVGTIGNGWGVSRDNGRTWRNWTYSDLGPEWQYVAPEGIVTSGDTTVIATADGLQITTNDGDNWVAIVDSVGPPTRGPADRAVVALSNEYILALEGPRRGNPSLIATVLPRVPVPTMVRLQIGELLGGSVADGARQFEFSGFVPTATDPTRQRYLSLIADSLRAIMPAWRPRFGRPIDTDGNQYIDQTYRWGSTMGGNFQPHQGVEFNNPDGTPVHAIGDGVVEWSGPAEAGALTVAIRHAPMQMPDGSSRYLYSVYYHNSSLMVQVGDTVRRGEVISRVGNTGRATNDHLHLEVHASPVDSVGLIVNPDERYPHYTTNPELWIEPMPRTGLIAGRVLGADGNPVQQTRIYGIHKRLPRETPLAFVETYGPRNKPSPMYGENFAISDVPAGRYHLKAKIGDEWVERSITVAPGVMSWVEFRP